MWKTAGTSNKNPAATIWSEYFSIRHYFDVFLLELRDPLIKARILIGFQLMGHCFNIFWNKNPAVHMWSEYLLIGHCLKLFSKVERDSLI